MLPSRTSTCTCKFDEHGGSLALQGDLAAQAVKPAHQLKAGRMYLKALFLGLDGVLRLLDLLINLLTQPFELAIRSATVVKTVVVTKRLLA